MVQTNLRVALVFEVPTDITPALEKSLVRIKADPLTDEDLLYITTAALEAIKEPILDSTSKLIQ